MILISFNSVLIFTFGSIVKVKNNFKPIPTCISQKKKFKKSMELSGRQ